MIETGDTAMATLEKVWRRKDYVKDPSLSSTQSECAEDAEDELDSELDADPTDENFMYNKTDILFCQHDLFRGSFDKTEEQVMAYLAEPRKVIPELKWDPYTPLSDMLTPEKDCFFSPHTLRCGTLISNIEVVGFPCQKSPKERCKWEPLEVDDSPIELDLFPTPTAEIPEESIGDVNFFDWPRKSKGIKTKPTQTTATKSRDTTRTGERKSSVRSKKKEH